VTHLQNYKIVLEFCAHIYSYGINQERAMSFMCAFITSRSMSSEVLICGYSKRLSSTTSLFNIVRSLILTIVPTPALCNWERAEGWLDFPVPVDSTPPQPRSAVTGDWRACGKWGSPRDSQNTKKLPRVQFRSGIVYPKVVIMLSTVAFNQL
jgi:hypothetical protein